MICIIGSIINGNVECNFQIILDYVCDILNYTIQWIENLWVLDVYIVSSTFMYLKVQIAMANDNINTN